MAGQDYDLSAVEGSDSRVVPGLKDVRRRLNQLPGFLKSVSAISTLQFQSLNCINVVGVFVGATENINDVI